MKTLKYVVLFVILIAVGIGVAIAARGSASTVSARHKIDPNAAKFAFVFHHVSNIKDKPGVLARYQAKIGLSDHAMEHLVRLAGSCDHEIAAIDARAQKIIDDYHAANPKGSLQPGQAPPAPPAELSQLESQREQTSMRYRGLLRSAIGDDDFNPFQAFIDREFESIKEAK